MTIRLIITYLLNLFDLYCTMQLVNRYGISIEANPIGRWLIYTNLAIPVKVFGMGAAMFALYVCIKINPRGAWISWLVLGVYAVLAVYNIAIICAM